MKFKYIFSIFIISFLLFILIGVLQFFLLERNVNKETNYYYKNRMILKDDVNCISCLDFFYNNFVGKLFRQILNKPLINKLVGSFQDSYFSKFLIKYFIARHKIDISTFEKPVNDYKTFNEFFTRKLRKGLRPINKKTSFVSPADSRLLVYQNISLTNSFYTKKEKFNLEKFLGSKTLAKKYEYGTLFVFRLTPVDYHWFHFPIDSFASKAKFINGYYESVDPIVYKSGFQPLNSNVRKIIQLKSNKFGDVIFVIIGAMMVGKIVTTYKPNKFYKKGDEIGYFKFGASTVAVLFERGKINNIKKEFINHSKHGYETYVQMGESLIS